MNTQAKAGVVYEVGNFWNGIGSIDGISSARIAGCTVRFMDVTGKKRCELPPGEYNASKFMSSCGNDVVTQYKVLYILVQ